MALAGRAGWSRSVCSHDQMMRPLLGDVSDLGQINVTLWAPSRRQRQRVSGS